MAARFVMLAFAVLTLAACQTATTEDTSVRRGASPTLGNLHRTQIRGPVVADDSVAPSRARQAGAVRSAAARSTRSARVVANPMRSPKVRTAGGGVPSTADAAAQMSMQTELAHRAAGGDVPAAPEQATTPDTSTSDAAAQMSMQTELAHRAASGEVPPAAQQPTGPAADAPPVTDASATMSMQTQLAHEAAVAGVAGGEAPAETTAPDTSAVADAATRMSMQTDLVHEAAATRAIDQTPVSEHPAPPIDFGFGMLRELTIDKIEAMFGGTPFLLIASIAAALVAALGLALRKSPKPKRDEDYGGPHLVENEDFHHDRDREPYAA
jgi:hypothetical protein